MNTFDPIKHEYTSNGRRLPSVTEIISAVYPRSFLAADYYLTRGSAIHASVALVMRGQDGGYEFDPTIAGQIEAARKWKREFCPVIIDVEIPIYTADYAGTPDLICELSGSRTVVDWKSSLAGCEHLQLYAYAAATGCTHGMTVLLRKDGTYQTSGLLRMRTVEPIWRKTMQDYKKLTKGQQE